MKFFTKSKSRRRPSAPPKAIRKRKKAVWKPESTCEKKTHKAIDSGCDYTYSNEYLRARSAQIRETERLKKKDAQAYFERRSQLW